MHTVNRERLIKTFMDLVKIPSPSWQEGEVIRYISARMKKLGARCRKVRCMESHNLYCLLPGNRKSSRPVLLSAHTDTVVPCRNIRPVIDGNRIRSDGTTILGSDDKSAVAMFIEAAEILSETGAPHGTVEFLFSCAEETGLFGAKHFDRKILKSKMAFVFDSGGRVGKIITRAPYHMTMEIIVRGKAAHAGMEPEKGLNAIKVLSEIITAVPSGRIDDETTANVGLITGGKATNIVPDDASCKLEIRSMTKSRMEEVEQAIRDTVKTAARRNRAGFTIKRNVEYHGFSIGREEPIVGISAEALRRIGIKPSFHASGGGSDTNIFNRAGIRAINLSCGMQRVHTTKEFILLKDLVDGARLALSLIDVAGG